jgi:CobQ-like glutamine amidotransferase family enzyme
MGIYPTTADYRPGRFAGEVAGTDYRGRETAGYINQVGTSARHDGQPVFTIIRCAKPIAAEEGIVCGPLFGTKLGGPALSLNPHLRDDVVDAILARRSLGSVADCAAPGFTEFDARVKQSASRAREGILHRLRSTNMR